MRDLIFNFSFSKNVCLKFYQGGVERPLVPTLTPPPPWLSGPILFEALCFRLSPADI